MTRRRWIADEISGDDAILAGEHARHLTQVLRAKVGQEFEISTGNEIRHGVISRITPNRVEFKLGEIIAQPAGFAIDAIISIFKFDRMEWAIEKCTELGVAKIVPLIAARTEPHLASAAMRRSERWKRIAHSASEQSRRVSPPEVTQPVRSDELFRATRGARVVLSEIESERSLKDVVPENAGPLALAFGPEGGWKNEELERFDSQGWVSASLGRTILRAETAVVAAVAIATSVMSSRE